MPEWLELYSTCVGFIADHVAVLTVAFTAFLFFRIVTGVFPSGMRKVFGRNEIPFWTTVRIVFLCWRSRSAQRMFFEFALLKSQGRKLDSRQWRELCGDFAIFLANGGNNACRELDIQNCTHLTERSFSLAVERYFAFLAGEKASECYSVGRLDDYWHTSIRIDEAYIMPSALLAGLMSKFDSNWEIFIGQYRAALSEYNDSEVSTSELYGLFSWLLWGPSREIGWQCGWDGLCQLAYGDENNSIPAYADQQNGTLDTLRRCFQSATEKDMFGGLFVARIRLAPKMDFVKQARFRMDIRNSYYVDKITGDSGMSFIPVLEKVQPAEPRIAERYYSTAYLWLLFERDNVDGRFHPEHAVAFFEHANLADASVCHFLQTRLVEKVLAHFRNMSEDVSASTRKYRIVCGMNAKLENSCKEKIMDTARGDSPFAVWLREHVSFEPRHEASTVFNAFDNFFRQTDVEVSFLDVDPSDRLACAELALFHVGVYSESFQNEDERETLPNLIRYLQESRKEKGWDFHVILAKDSSNLVVGGIVFDYFHETNSVVVEFLCVDPDIRERHIGTMLWSQALKVADILASRHGKIIAEHVFCEVDSPEISRDGKLRHLAFWRNKWFGRLNFEYTQPSLDDGLKPVHGLWLLGLSRSASNRTTMDGRVVERTIWNYLHHSMHISAPEEDECFKAMKEQLSRLGKVELSKF